MDRAKDHICFAIWFVGISYMALWPLALPCGLATESWRDLCQSHEALMLSPGLHLTGGAAACCVTLRVLLLLLRRLLRMLLPPAVQRTARWQKFSALLRLGCDVPAPPRWVPPRRDFGLRRPMR